MVKKEKKARHYLDKKLLFRLRIFIGIALVMAVIVGYECVTDGVNPVFALFGFAIGFVIGIFLGKNYGIQWKEKEEKIVTQMDRTGFIILGIYIIFSLSRRVIFGEFIQGPALSVVTLSVTAGVMLGRVFFIQRRIKDLLKNSGF